MYNVKVENKKINYKKKSLAPFWPRSFRGEDFFNISQSKTRIALGSHICWPNGTKQRNLKLLCKVLYYSKMVNLISVELCTQLMHHMKIYKKESCSHVTYYLMHKYRKQFR
jgi:hypothetical protein